MGGKTVPQHVRCERSAEAGLTAIGREYLPNAHAAEGRAATIDKQRCGERLFTLANQLGARITKKTFNQGQGFLADRDDAFLVALANATDAADRDVEIHDPKADEFRNAQARGVENVQHSAIAQAQ